MPTNYNLKPKRLKQKLNNIERPENRVHRLGPPPSYLDQVHTIYILAPSSISFHLYCLGCDFAAPFSARLSRLYTFFRLQQYLYLVSTVQANNGKHSNMSSIQVRTKGFCLALLRRGAKLRPCPPKCARRRQFVHSYVTKRLRTKAVGTNIETILMDNEHAYQVLAQ